MSDQRAEVPGVRGYVVFREEEPGLWKLVGDVDYQPGLTARAARIQAVKDALAAAGSDGGSAGQAGNCAGSAAGGHAALPRDQWHVLHHG
jgi:hypothetical protein